MWNFQDKKMNLTHESDTLPYSKPLKTIVKGFLKNEIKETHT